MPRKRIPDIEILKLVDQKLSISEIAFKLGVTKGAISQRIKKLQERGLIELDIEESSYRRSLTLSDVKIFRLTEKGKKEVYNLITGGEAGRKLPQVRGVHAVQFKFPIKKDADFWYDHEVALNGWVRKYTWIGDVNIEKTTKHIIIRFGIVDSDPWRAAYKALRTALNVKRFLEKDAGYELGDPIQIGKPKWEVIGDPVAEKVSEKQVVVTDVGAIDSTPEPGTLHFYDPEDVMAYLEMPREVREIKQEVQEVKREVQKVPEIVAEMMKSMAVEIGREIAQAVLHPETKISSRDLSSSAEKISGEVEGYA